MLLAALLVLQVSAGAPPQSPAAARGDSTAADTAPRARRTPPRRLPVTPALLASAFADPAARDLLSRARAARLRHDSLLLSYDAKTLQRISVGMGLRRTGRDRLLLRSENAAHVRWQRGVGVWLEPTGQRTVSPIIDEAKTEIDAEDMAPIPYFPGREALWFPSSEFGTVRAEVNDREMVHPLATGAEAYYRYATGDSVIFGLPDGRRIALRELRITARRPEWRLFVGSFWFDVESAQLVRAAYRMAVDMDIWAVAEEEHDEDVAELRRDTTAAGRARLRTEDEDEVPGWVKAAFNPARATISAITVEYGLHEERFWMPRANVAEGSAQVGFIRVPFKLEERFTYASVNGRDTLPPLPPLLTAAGDTVPDDSTSDTRVSVNIGGRPGDGAATSPDSVASRFAVTADSLQRAADRLAAAGDTAGARRLTVRAERARRSAERVSRRAARRAAQRLARERECATGSTYVSGVRTRYDGALQVAVRMPCDSTRLAHSPDLPASIYEPGEELFGDADRRDLLAALDLSLQPEWAPQPPTLHWGLDMVRYNRVEGLSVGVAARQMLGRGYTAELAPRIGVADLQPNAELSLARSNGRRTVRATLFRRLAVANDDWGAPLSFGSSLASFLYGRDEGFYYRAWGLELAGQGEEGARLAWRLFAERHDDADVETQFSLGKALWNTRFVGNIEAREGTVAGAGASLHRTYGLDPSALRLVADVRAEAAVGDFDYVRGAADATLSRNLGRRLAGALTASAGTSGGALPPQRAWYLGGLQTVRGQTAGTSVGDAYWMGRAELGTSAVAARPVVFYDLGWAGSRTDWAHPGTPISGAGVGASFLDGLVRVDIARGIRPDRHVRADVYLEARF